MTFGQAVLSAPSLARLARSWPFVAAAIAASSLLIVFLLIPDTFVPDPWLGWVDAWYYVRIARTLPAALTNYSYLYQSERIAFTLPLYLVNKVLPALAANHIVKSAFFVAAVVFLFGTLRQTCSLRTCAFVTAMAATYS